MKWKLFKIVGGTMLGVAIVAAVAGSVAGCLIHKDHQSTNDNQETTLTENTNVLKEIYNLKNSYSVQQKYTFAQFKNSSVATQKQIIKQTVINVLSGKKLSDGYTLTSINLEKNLYVAGNVSLNAGAGTVIFYLGYGAVENLNDSFTLTDFSLNAQGANPNAVELLPAFQNLTNTWNDATAINSPMVNQTVLNSTESYFNYLWGVKKYFPLTQSAALQLPSVANAFDKWFTNPHFATNFQDEVLTYLVQNVEANYSAWGQTNNLQIKNGVFLQNTTAQIIPPTSKTLAQVQSFEINLQVANTSSNPETFNLFGTSFSVVANGLLGLTINFQGAQIQPILQPTSTTNTMALSYTIQNLVVTNVQTKQSTKIGEPIIITKNPPSLNTVVANTTTAIGTTGLMPTVQKTYLDTITNSQATNTVTTFAENSYKLTQSLGESVVQIINALIPQMQPSANGTYDTTGLTFGNFLQKIGGAVGQMFTDLGLPSAYATLISNFLSSQTVSDFVLNNQNETAIESIIRQVTNSPLVMNGFQSLWGSLWNTFSDGSTVPTAIDTPQAYNPNISVIANLENFLQALPNYGGTTMVEFVGDNLNFFFNVVQNGLGLLNQNLPKALQTTIQTVLTGVEQICNLIQPGSIVSVKADSKVPVAPTNIAQANYANIILSPKTMAELVSTFAQTIGTIFPSSFQKILGLVERIFNGIEKYDAEITPTQMMMIYQSLLSFAVVPNTDVANPNPATTFQHTIPLAQLFSPEYFGFTVNQSNLTCQNGIINGSLTYQIALKQNICFNLEPIEQILLKNITVKDALVMAGVQLTSLEWFAVDTTVGGKPITDYIPAYLLFETGEGITDTISFDQAQMGVKYDTNAGALSWVAPMRISTSPSFYQTASEFISYFEDSIDNLSDDPLAGFGWIINREIDAHVRKPIYFYLHYDYTENYLFNSASLKPNLGGGVTVDGTSGTTSALNNEWFVPNSIAYSPNAITGTNTFTFNQSLNTTTSQSILAQISQIFNSLVTTNANPSSPTDPSSNIDTYNYENINLNQTAQQTIWGMLAKLCTIGSQTPVPQILANITPSFQLSETISQQTSTIRNFSLQLYFTHPVVYTNADGISELTNWITLPLPNPDASSTNSAPETSQPDTTTPEANHGQPTTKPAPASSTPALPANESIYKFTTDGVNAYITGLNTQNLATYEKNQEIGKPSTVVTTIPQTIQLEAGGPVYTVAGIGEPGVNTESLFNGDTISWNVTIPSTISEITPYAFNGATFKNAVSMAANQNLQAFLVKNTGSHPFAGSIFDGTFTFQNGWTQLPASFFNVNTDGGQTATPTTFNAGLNLPNTMTTIGAWSFNGSVFKQELQLPNSVTQIGAYAFANSIFEQSLTLPSQIASLNGEYALAYDKIDGNLTLPATVTQIGWWLFYETNIVGNLTIQSSKLSYETSGWIPFHNSFDKLSVDGNLYIPANNDYQSAITRDATIGGQIITEK